MDNKVIYSIKWQKIIKNIEIYEKYNISISYIKGIWEKKINFYD